MSTNEDKQDTPAISLTAACSGSCHGPVGPAGDADAGEDTKEDTRRTTKRTRMQASLHHGSITSDCLHGIIIFKCRKVFVSLQKSPCWCRRCLWGKFVFSSCYICAHGYFTQNRVPFSYADYIHVYK